MPLGRVTRPTGEDPQTLIQPQPQLFRCEQLDPGGGQLDGQRQPVDKCAYLSDDCRVGIAQPEVGTRRAGPFNEQGAGIRLLD